MSDDLLLEPLKAYNMLYRQKFKDEAEAVFEELRERSGLDVEANRETIKKLRKLEAELKTLEKKKSKQRRNKGFAIFGIIFSWVICPIIIVLCALPKPVIPIPAAIPSAIAALAVGIVLIIVIKKILNKRIGQINDEIAKKMALANEARAEAERQMAPLNALYDWNLAALVVTRVIPTLQMDRLFDRSKHGLLVDKYGLDGTSNPDISTLYVQSGSILGNPFLIQRAKVHRIIDMTYTGTLTISWTETHTDSKGNSYTVTRTQTLTASVTHEAPEYTYKTRLIYGNPAAPDLKFSRKPQKMTGKSEKEIYKFVRKQEKELAELAQKSISRGGNFTPLQNSEFEALFHAWNRNHEQQFRLLFTPLAQQNEVDLVTKEDGFGDDFIFEKTNMINEISSKHSQVIDYSGDPTDYIDYEYDEAKRKFVNYVCVFAKGFYFDMAPLLAIPLYQQTKSLEYIYGKDCPENYSYYEHEVMANSFNSQTFAHEDTTTDVILKTTHLRKDGKADKLLVHASSYRGEPRITYVPKLGGDGRWHDVPVHWIEYIPVEKDTMMEVADTNASRFDFNNKIRNNGFNEFISRYALNGSYSFKRGLLAILGGESYTSSSDSELSGYFRNPEDK